MLSCTCLQLFQFLNIFNVSGIHPTQLKWFSSPTWTLEWFSWGRCLIFRIKNFKINCNEWWRYIYVRFASDLASSGDKLFKILVSVSILTFCLQWLIIYPVVGNIISVNCSRININLWSGNLKVENYPLNSIKGKICTQTFINEFENQEENVDMILKPKFILYTTGNKKLQKIPTKYSLTSQVFSSSESSSGAQLLLREWLKLTRSRSIEDISWPWSPTVCSPAALDCRSSKVILF